MSGDLALDNVNGKRVLQRQNAKSWTLTKRVVKMLELLVVYEGGDEMVDLIYGCKGRVLGQRWLASVLWEEDQMKR